MPCFFVSKFPAFPCRHLPRYAPSRPRGDSFRVVMPRPAPAGAGPARPSGGPFLAVRPVPAKPRPVLSRCRVPTVSFRLSQPRPDPTRPDPRRPAVGHPPPSCPALASCPAPFPAAKSTTKSTTHAPTKFLRGADQIFRGADQIARPIFSGAPTKFSRGDDELDDQFF